MVCRLCEEAPCVIACPREALEQSFETGLILIDEKLCNGCGWCIPTCPYGAITMNPEKRVVMICDLCEGDPKCVAFCPEEALELGTEEDIVPLKAAVDKLLAEIKEMQKAVKSGKWEHLIIEVDKKMKRLEEKLLELSEKELELQSQVISEP
jgi:Fe-S-cluster-containing dehydrogenase component